MRKFYTFIASMALAAAVTTQAAAPYASLHKSFEAKENTRQGAKAHPKGKQAAQFRSLQSTASTSTMLKAPAKAPSITLTDIIFDTPAGTATPMSRDCGAYFPYWGYIFEVTDLGSAVTMVDAGTDGEIWFNNPISIFPLQSWYKAKKSADGSEITISGAQHIYQEMDEDGTYDFFLVPVEHIYDEQEGGFYYATDKEYKLTLQDGVYVNTDEDLALGICELDEGTLYWTGYADFDIAISEQKSVKATVPADLTSESWNVRTANDGYLADVAVAGDKIYVKGFLTTAPDAWIIGDIAGDKVSFAAGQYLGEDESMHYAYLYGGIVESVYDEYWDEYNDEVTITGDAIFNYDAAGKTLSGCPAVLTTTTEVPADGGNAFVSFYSVNPILKYQLHKAGDRPANPTDIVCSEYDEDYGEATVGFNFPNEDVAGCILPADKLYYRVYMDGELYVFYPDEYRDLTEELSMIPYSYEDYDIYATGRAHTFYYFSFGVETIGIQTVFMEGDTELVSDIVTVNVGESAIRQITGAAKEIKDVTYYDLQGRAVANPAKGGFYVVRTTFTDGSVKSAKVVK